MQSTTKRAYKVFAVIPCLNESKHIGSVVRGALQYVDKAVVADDNSQDDTRQVAYDNGGIVIGSTDYDLHGYGVNVRRGIQCALHHDQADILVFLDGDGQHDTRDIPYLLQPILDGRADIVMGNRIIGNVPGYRRFGNRLLSAACNIGSRYKTIDAMTGFWAIKTNALPELTETAWGLMIELLMKARSKNLRIVGVPVRSMYHSTCGENSTAHPIKLGACLLFQIIKWRLIGRT